MKRDRDLAERGDGLIDVDAEFGVLFAGELIAGGDAGVRRQKMP
jgi:hypothetical protein